MNKIKEHYETEPVKAELVSKIEVRNVEEADDITISTIKAQILEVDKPRELWICCDAPSKRICKALRLSIMLANHFDVASCLKMGGVWVVQGMKMICIDQLKNELKSVRETVALHSCELVDWHVEVDKGD